MADNAKRYGFRWARSFNGKECPQPVERVVASAYQAQDDASSDNVDLNIGDPVKQVNDGTVALANNTDPVWGIVVGFGYYWNGSVMTPTNRLPGGTSWSTEPRKSTVLVVPASAGYWEVDVDDNTTATTRAAYRAFIGENAEHVCAGDTTDSDRPKADPQLDISSHATTEGLGWRIEEISQTEDNRDFSGQYVKLIVRVNDSQEAGAAATNVVGV